jgi:cobalamin biosynthesis Mg chelatase CobN
LECNPSPNQVPGAQTEPVTCSCGSTGTTGATTGVATGATTGVATGATTGVATGATAGATTGATTQVDSTRVDSHASTSAADWIVGLVIVTVFVW